MLIRFKELRELKDRLPHGSMKQIANELNLNEDQVRNFFGGTHYGRNTHVDAHYEQGGEGVVELQDSRIYESALKRLSKREFS